MWILSTDFSDFTPLDGTITFTDSGILCVNISIVTMDAFENFEKFSVVLTTLDDRIKIKRRYATVYIVEDGG